MRFFFVLSLIILLLMGSTPVRRAQEKRSIPPPDLEECGSRPTQRQREAEMERLAAASLAAPEQIAPPTGAPYYLPLSIHIVRASNGTGGLSEADLYASVDNLNRLWRPMGVQFFVFGAIDYINNDGLLSIPDNQANQDALRQVNPVANTINVYFTGLVGLNGQGSFTGDTFQGILMNQNICTLVSAPASANLSTFAHEMGHYFDLYHTHEDWRDDKGQPTAIECPSGNNCTTNGDLVCDTPADPNLSGRVIGACAYNNSAALPGMCDKTPYNPPVRNIMSYSTGDCRTEFTAGQIQRTLRTLRDTANRRNLIINGARYVDPLASRNNGDCSYNFPCHSIPKAVGLALNGDFIFIKPGSYIEPGVSGKRVTLRTWGNAGSVFIRP